MAAQALLKALVQEPGRHDLSRRILELNALPEGAGQRFTAKASRRWTAAHFFMGCVVQFALFAGIFVLGVTFALSLFGEGPVGGLAHLAIVLAISSGYCLFLVFAWARFYLAFRFRYLWWVPRDQAANAASWLAAYRGCWQFSSDYWRRKNKFYVERYSA